MSDIVCKNCHLNYDHHGLNENCLEYKSGKGVGFLGTTYVPLFQKKNLTIRNLMDLVTHMQIYEGYKNNGYEKMSMEMKALYMYIEDLKSY